MEGKSAVTRSIIDELHSSHIQRDQMEREKGFTRGIIDELHSSDIQGDEIEGESMVLHEISLMNFILRICKEMKWKAKAC